MAIFQSQKKSARNLVLSVNSQAAIGGALADMYLTRRQRFDGSAVLEQKQTRRSDKEMSGKGTEFGTDGQVTGWDTSLSLKTNADDWILGWALAFLMGADAVTGAGPYTHAFTFDESTTECPVTTVYFEDTAAIKTKYPDMAMSDLTITIPTRGPISLDISMMGTGRWADGAMAAGPPALVSYNYLLGSDCDFQIGAAGAPVSILGRHMASTIKLSTGVVNHISTGGGLYGIFMRRDGYKFSYQTTIAAKDTDDVRTLFNNDTESEVKWIVNSGASAQLTIDIPKAHLKTNKIGVDGNMIVWQIEGDETTSYNEGAGALTATVINSVAKAYLAAH